MAKRGKQGRRATNKAEKKVVDALDELAEFEEYKQTILKTLRKALQRGADSEEILKLGESLAAARQVTVAATSESETNAMAASKDVLDRTRGKAKENKEIAHKFDNLSDEELAAAVASKVDRLVEDEEDDHQTH